MMFLRNLIFALVYLNPMGGQLFKNASSNYSPFNGFFIPGRKRTVSSIYQAYD